MARAGDSARKSVDPDAGAAERAEGQAGADTGTGADKTAETAMQPLQDVFMLERETELNMGTLKNIIATGHSECWQPAEAGRRRMPESGLCVQDARGWMPGAVSSRPSCVARRVLAAARRTRYAASAAFSRP